MEVISEETIFHQQFWTTDAAPGGATMMDGGSGRSSPCPPSSSKDKSNDLPMPNDEMVVDDSDEEFEEESEDEESLPVSPKRVLEPLPTFATDWRRENYFAPSFAPPSPPAGSSSACLRSPQPLPACSSVLFAAGGSPAGPVEVRGPLMGEWGPVKGEQVHQQQSRQQPNIHLPPIRTACSVAQPQESAYTAYRADKQVPPKKRGKRLGVAPVPCKKSTQTTSRMSETRKSGKFVVGVLKTTTTTTTTLTTAALSPPASPPASSSYCRSPPTLYSNVVPFDGNNNVTRVPQAAPSAACAQQATSQKQSAADSRKRVTPAQLVILERAFECGMIPDLETRKRLAEQLGFTERRVQIWFQNRRAKMKKDNQKSSVFIINCGIDSFKN